MKHWWTKDTKTREIHCKVCGKILPKYPKFLTIKVLEEHYKQRIILSNEECIKLND